MTKWTDLSGDCRCLPRNLSNFLPVGARELNTHNVVPSSLPGDPFQTRAQSFGDWPTFPSGPPPGAKTFRGFWTSWSAAIDFQSDLNEEVSARQKDACLARRFWPTFVNIRRWKSQAKACRYLVGGPASPHSLASSHLRQIDNLIDTHSAAIAVTSRRDVISHNGTETRRKSEREKKIWANVYQNTCFTCSSLKKQKRNKTCE